MDTKEVVMETVPKEPARIEWMEELVGIVKTHAINKKEVAK